MGVAAVTLSACASIPDLGAASQPGRADSYSAERSFRAPAAEWPTDSWWQAYGDSQLDTLIDEALAGSPDLAAAQARVVRAEALAQQAGATLAPRIDGNASASAVKQSYNNGVPKAAVPEGWNDTGQVGASLTWQLDLYGRNRALLAAATSQAEAARADAATARLMLSTSVAGAYAGLAQLYAEQDAAREALRVRSETESLLAQRFAQGLETRAAVERAHAGRAAAEAQLQAVDEAIGLTRNAIAALLGQGPDRGLAIGRPAPDAIRAFGLPANLQADLVGRRPDVVAARLTAEAGAQRIKVAKADFYPNVNLTAVVGLQSLGLDVLAKSDSMMGSVGPAISLPIFSGGRLEGAYKGARADYELAVAAYNQTLTQALKEVADAAVSARSLDGRLAKTREAFDASRSAYELARLRYARGLGNYLDVLTAEDSLIQNRRALAALEARAFTLDVALVRALGGGYGA